MLAGGLALVSLLMANESSDVAPEPPVRALLCGLFGDEVEPRLSLYGAGWSNCGGQGCLKS